MDKKKTKEEKIGHHAKPKRASATAALRTGADMCRTGVGAGSSAGADKEPDRRQLRRATTNGRTTKQEGWPTSTQTEAASCAPQTTHQARTPRPETRIATSCAKGGDVPVQQQGRGGTGRAKPWQPQQGYDQKEMLQATPPMHDQTQNTL